MGISCMFLMMLEKLNILYLGDFLGPGKCYYKVSLCTSDIVVFVIQVKVVYTGLLRPCGQELLNIGIMTCWLRPEKYL